MSTETEIQQKIREVTERAKNDLEAQAVLRSFQQARENSELQAAIKDFLEEAKKYAPAVRQIEEVQVFQDIFETIKEEATKLSGENSD